MSEGTRQGALGPASTDEGFSATVAAITSAFGDATRRQIYLFARERHGVTATEVAEHFALHPNVARHHLDKLAAGGYLDVFVDRDNAGVGRPSKRYLSGTGDASAAVPALRDDLLLALLAACWPSSTRSKPSSVAHEVGAEYGRSLALQMAPGEAPRSLRSAMQSVAHAAHGARLRRPQRGRRAAERHRAGPLSLRRPPPSTTRCYARPTGARRGSVDGLCGDSVPVKFSSRRARRRGLLNRRRLSRSNAGAISSTV